MKYTDVVCERKVFTMIVRLSGGRDAMSESPFMVFKNADRNCIIRGVPDDVPGVACQTGLRGLLDTTVITSWICETSVIKNSQMDGPDFRFVDKCRENGLTDDLKAAAQTIKSKV